jgi:hypothetical protein
VLCIDMFNVSFSGASAILRRPNSHLIRLPVGVEQL